MMNKRDTVKTIHVGKVTIGANAPVSVQTMCNTKTWDVEATVNQIKAMQTAGADISREAVRQAGKRDRTLEWAVASVFRLPVAAVGGRRDAETAPARASSRGSAILLGAIARRMPSVIE